jgi:hypothetical protein
MFGRDGAELLSTLLAHSNAVFNPRIVEADPPKTANFPDVTSLHSGVHARPPFFFAARASACRASPAFRARSVRCCFVSFFALALPPMRPILLSALRVVSSMFAPFLPVSLPVSY